MDYNIKFKYEGAGGKSGGSNSMKTAFATRQKVLQAQRQSGLKPNENTIGVSRELVSSIRKLIASNKSLEQAIKSQSGRGPGPGPGGPGGGMPRPTFGGSSGFGGMGAAIPILGAIVAGIGFAIQKTNEIANAYIGLVSQQAGTVGVAGMHYGRRGMYLQTEQGAMERAYRMSTGLFGPAGNQVQQGAVQVGSIFGMGGAEIGGLAGTFARARGNIGTSAELAMGAGIETEMPLFLQGMASIMQEAITAGVNQSNLADELGERVAVLTRANPTNSVQMALNMIRSQRSLQQQVGQGQVQSYEQLMSYLAAGEAINQQLSTPEGMQEYLDDLLSLGIVTQQEIDAAYERATLENRDMTLADLEAQDSNIGPVLRRLYSEAGHTNQQQLTVQAHQQNLGGGAAGLRRHVSLNLAGMGDTIREQATIWNAPDQLPPGTQQQGALALQQRFTQTQDSAAFIGLEREAERNRLLMTHGGAFAQASLAMEEAMISLADTIAPQASTIRGFGETIAGATNAVTGFITRLGNVINGRQRVGITDIPDLLFGNSPER